MVRYFLISVMVSLFFISMECKDKDPTCKSDCIATKNKCVLGCKKGMTDGCEKTEVKCKNSCSNIQGIDVDEYNYCTSECAKTERKCFDREVKIENACSNGCLAASDKCLKKC